MLEVQSEHLVVSELDGETIIYDKRTHQATCLNSFAARVWHLCDGRRTPADIASAMNVDNREADVHDALGKLVKSGLLSPDKNLPVNERRSFLAGLSAGLASVSTMAIPSPAAAVSANAGANGDFCGTVWFYTMFNGCVNQRGAPDDGCCGPGLICTDARSDPSSPPAPAWKCRPNSYNGPSTTFKAGSGC